MEIDEVLDLIDDVVSFYSRTDQNGMFTAWEFGTILKEQVQQKFGGDSDAGPEQ